MNLSYDSTTFASTSNLYINSILESTWTFSPYFFEDHSHYELVLGSPINSNIYGLSSGLAGFILSLQIYNNENFIGIDYATSACGGCSACPGSLLCPGLCDLTQLESSCSACASCPNGCVELTGCNLCADPLCSSCSSFTGTCEVCSTGAALVDATCVCTTGYTLVATACQPCHYSCSSCTHTTYSGCTACAPGYLWFTDLSRCLPGSVCPNHYGTGSTCTYSGIPLIFSVTFSGISNTVYDTVGNLPVQSGGDSSFYPSYSTNDVWAVKGRGYYFTSSSFMTVGPQGTSSIVLAPEFTIALWACVVTDGTIFSRSVGSAQYLSLYASAGIHVAYTDIAQTAAFAWGGNFAYNAWALIEMGKFLNGDGEQPILYINGQYTYTVTSSYYLDPVSSVSTLLGLPYYGFQGYVWSMQIYNRQLQSGYNTGNACVYPVSLTACLSTCGISQFSIATSCNNCPVTCAYSCGFANSCSLCDDILCATCADYSTCSACTSNAAYITQTGLCACNSGFIAVIDTCSPCHISCMQCTGVTYADCVGCSTGYLEFIDFARCLPYSVCPNSYGTGIGCVFNNTALIFAAVFNVLQDIIYDSVGGVPIQSGSNSSFYPDYEKNDVIGAYDRGVYFKQTSYLNIGNTPISEVVLGPLFTISLWILVEGDGVVFLRKTSTTDFIKISNIGSMSASINTLAGTYSVVWPGTFTTGVWHVLELAKTLMGDGESLFLSVDQVLASITYSSYYADPLAGPTTWLGHDSQSFQGFLWSISISNAISPLPYSLASNCIYPSALISCLPTCTITSYYDSTSLGCMSCKTGCDSCVNGSSCSLCPDILCANCPNYGVCTECKNNASLGTSCTCNSPTTYLSISESCIHMNCYPGCSVCVNETVYGCLQCNTELIMLNSVCSQIPTGYIFANGGYKSNNALVFSMELTGIVGVIHDSVSSIPVITGNSADFYPYPDSEDPIPAYLRGYYFDGTKSLMRMPQYQQYTFPSLILAPTWGLEAFILPNSGQGTLLFSTSSTIPLFTLFISSNALCLNVTLAGSNFSYSASNSSLIIGQWNSLYISLVYTGSTQISIYINSVLTSTTLVQGIYINTYNPSSITIGGAPGLSYYRGFLYLLQFDSSATPPVSSQGLSACLVPLRGACLPLCDITHYWSGPSPSDCLPCLASCSSCVLSTSCKLCEDPLCEHCEDYSPTGCTQCSNNAGEASPCACQSPSNLDLLSGQCVICTSSQIFNGNTCKDCSEYCSSCNTTACLVCSANAYLVGTGCACQLGFFGTSACEPSFLYAAITVTSSNNINLVFTAELAKELRVADIKLTACVDISFVLEKWSIKVYYITVTILVAVPANCMVVLEFTEPLDVISVENAAVSNSSVVGVLYEGSSTAAVNAISKNAAAATSATVTTCTTAASVSISMMNPNPACLWSFINTIQMLCFIEMSSIPLSPKFSGYLIGLKKYNMFPNFFAYFVPESGGQAPFQKAYDYGYKTNLLILNSGNYVSAFLTMLVLFFFTIILSKFTHLKPFSIEFVKKKIMTSLQNYKYGAFIRFWITCYLDVFAAALIVIITTDKFTVQLIINLVVAIFIIVRDM